MEWERFDNPGQKVPIKSWCRDIEGDALRQAYNIASLDFAVHHVALMPDCHTGFGMPIGGVLAAYGVVVPNAVGVDIGCGMCAVKTTLDEIDRKPLSKIVRDIRHTIPLGFNHHKQPQQWDGFNTAPDLPVIRQEISSAAHQIGTLGGGNHFIEVQKGDDGLIWLMVHSGSRNFGLKIAKAYHKKALSVCHTEGLVYPDKQLAYLPLDTPAASEYLDAMNFALLFAQANRDALMERFQEIVKRYVSCGYDSPINIHHNYAARETHFDTDVMVHRKGATAAGSGQYGIIPGSQGAPSYIVKGLGNPDSFHSCSHGAGRVMSRKKAIKILNLDSVQEKLDRRGIIHSIHHKGDLDEAPEAYKDIDSVIQSQRDLVEVVTRLSPLAVVKG